MREFTRRFFLGALLSIALLAGAPSAQAAKGWWLHVKPPANTVVARLAPNSAWTGGYNTSGGSAPVADGVAYGLQAITAVGTDASFSGVPQLTVPSTALMSEGDEFRVASTGLTGLDGQYYLHVVDSTHVDLCDAVAASGATTPACTINANLHPPITTSGYAGGGQIWFDENAVAAFAEHPNVWVEGTGDVITVGAASDTAAFIKDVKFCVDTVTDCYDVTSQSRSPYGNYFGWSINLTSRLIGDPGGQKDGLATLYAVVTPYNGFQRVLSLPVVLNTNSTIRHPLFYVNNAPGVGSDTCDGQASAPASAPINGHCAVATIAKVSCLAYAAPYSSTTVGPIVHVAGGAVPGGAGQEYAEVASGGCPTTHSEFPVRYIADAPVYITTTTSASAPSTGSCAAAPVENCVTFVQYSIPSFKSTWEGPFAFDTEYTKPYISQSYGMFWLGNGTLAVAAAGPNNTLYGAQGPAAGYYFGNPGTSPTAFDATGFFGMGEATVNSITEAGPVLGNYLLRDVNSNVSIDCVQFAASAAYFNVHCTHAQPEVGRQTLAQTLTVASVSCITTYPGTTANPALDITFTTSPYAAPYNSPPPVYLTALTGNGGNNNGGSLYMHVGSAGTLNVDIYNSGAVVRNPGDMDVALNPTPYGCVQPSGGGNATSADGTSVNFSDGDTVIMWSEGHPDFMQVTKNFTNTYIQNYEASGEDLQPALFQGAGNAIYVNGGPAGALPTYISTSGENFTLSNLAAGIGVGTPLNIGSTSTKSPYIGRRVTSVVQQTATFAGSFQSVNNNNSTSVSASDPVTGTIQPGMELYYSTAYPNCTGSAYIDTGNFIVSQQSETSGDAAGAGGMYTMSKGFNAGVLTRCMMAVGISGGTLNAAFPTDIPPSSNVIPYIGQEVQDFACINCMLDTSVHIPGLLAQWQSAQRHVFLKNFTTTALPTNTASLPVSSVGYDGIFQAGGAGYYSEASGYDTAIMPPISVAGNNATTNAAVQALIGPGSGTTRNTQTTVNGLSNQKPGLYFQPGTSFNPTSFLAINPNGMLTRDAKNAAAVPWDIHGFPTAAGMPIGAVAH